MDYLPDWSLPEPYQRTAERDEAICDAVARLWTEPHEMARALADPGCSWVLYSDLVLTLFPDEADVTDEQLALRLTAHPERLSKAVTAALAEWLVTWCGREA